MTAKCVDALSTLTLSTVSVCSHLPPYYATVCKTL